MAEQPVPPGQAGSEPGSIAHRAFSSEGEDPVAAGLRQLVEEQHGAGSAEEIAGSVATAPKPERGRFGQIVEKLKGIKFSSIPKPHLPHVSMPHIPTPHIPRPHMPEVSLPSIPRPDFSGVGEALGNVREAALKNRVIGILYSAGESYLNKFDPRGKDVKVWAGGILGGAASVIAVAEAGATLGFSPVIRGVAVAATLNVSDLLYSQVHRIYLSRTLGGMAKGADFLKEGANKAEVRKQIMVLEKSIAARKLTGQDFKDTYEKELRDLLAPYAQDAKYLSDVEQQTIATELVNKLGKLGRDYATVNKTAKSLAAGMSAGSMVGALGEVGIRSILKGSVAQALVSQETIQLPRAEAPAPTTATPTPIATETITPAATQAAAGAVAETATPAATLPPTETTTPAATPTPAPTVEATPAPVSAPPTTTELPADLKDKLNVLESTQEYKTEIAAEVGKYLGARDDIVNTAIKAKDILPAEIDSASFEAGKEAALKIMEGKGNEIFDQAAKEVLTNNPNADVSQITETAQKAYADWLSTEAAQTQIAEASQNAIADHLQIENTLAENIAKGLESHQDWFQDTPLERGTTAGKILNLTWTPADAPVMGANIAANYDTLTDIWGNMAKVHPDLLANGSFPVSLSELNDLVARAETGDQEALKKLRRALHWIPAGSKFRAVAATASKEVLKLVA